MQPRLSLLGGAVIGDRASGAPLPLDLRGALLAYLAYGGGWVDRDRLVVLFWPDTSEGSAKRNLRQLLHRTKRLDLGVPLEVTDRALRWHVATDVSDFRRHVAEGDSAAAVEVYRGPLLHGLAPEGSRGFDAWLESERALLHSAFHAASLSEAARATSEGRYDAAAGLLARLHAEDPLAEDVVEASMRALYLNGRRDAALGLYQRFATELASELGLEPLTSTRELLRQIVADAPLDVEQPRAAPATRGLRELAPTKLVGRDVERAALLAAATPVVMLEGEPGIGKSALLAELYAQGLRTGAREGLERMPYHPLVALLRSRPELVEPVGDYTLDLARLVPELAPGAVPPPADPDTAKLRVAEALALVAGASGRLIAVDDLQWADEATLACLVYLSGRGIRVVGAYRPEEVSPPLRAALAGWRSRGELTRVRLEPIAESGAAVLMADLMNVAEGPALFSRRLWERTGGNPLFMLETLRALFDAGVLRTDDSGWHTSIDDITVDYSELDLPPRVTEVIGRRLDRLDPAAVRVLEVLALAPVAVAPSLVAKITGLSLPATLQALDGAEAAGFVTAGRFRHDLLREATSARLSPTRAKVSRTLLAGALADERGEDADPGVLAELWWQAGEHTEARHWWLAQVFALRSRGLHLAALEVLAGAIERLPEGEDARRLKLAVAETTLEGGWFERVPELLDAVKPEADDSPELHARLALARGTRALSSGSYLDAEAAVASQRHWFTLSDDDELRLDLIMFDARIATHKGELDAAIALIEPAVAELRRRRATAKSVTFVSGLAALYDNLRRHDEALPLHHEAIALARSLGSRYLAAEVSINLLYCLADLGRYDEAIEYGEEALASTTFDNEPVVRTNLAAAYRQSGRFAEAARHYNHLAESAQPHLRVIALARWAESVARLGDAAEAVRLIDSLLEAVPGTDFLVALGVTAIVVHRFGTDTQLATFERLVPSLDPEQVPGYLRGELDGAVAERRPRQP